MLRTVTGAGDTMMNKVTAQSRPLGVTHQRFNLKGRSGPHILHLMVDGSSSKPPLCLWGGGGVGR